MLANDNTTYYVVHNIMYLKKKGTTTKLSIMALLAQKKLSRTALKETF